MSGLGGGVVRWSLVLGESPIGCEEKSSLNLYIYSFSNFPYPFSSLLVIGRILCLAIVPEVLSSSRCSRLFLAQIVSY